MNEYDINFHLIVCFVAVDGGMHKNIGLLETLANTKSMLIKIDAEFNSIKFDSECYVYDLNGIHTHRVCSKPHLVVWAKFLTYVIIIFNSKIFPHFFLYFLHFYHSIFWISNANFNILGIHIGRPRFWQILTMQQRRSKCYFSKNIIWRMFHAMIVIYSPTKIQTTTWPVNTRRRFDWQWK